MDSLGLSGLEQSPENPGWWIKRVTNLRSSRSSAGRSSVGKRQWRVRKRDLVAGEAARRELDGGGSLVESVWILCRELKREAMKARGRGRMEAMRMEHWGVRDSIKNECHANYSPAHIFPYNCFLI